ncbi:MAG TPA: YceI family protein [Bacteroidales bacterium]|nr:YceI family protein [Bacteroidales bacterium]
MKKIILLSAFLLAGSQLLLMAQKQFLLSEKDSKIVVEGTSSLHDWDMNLEKMSGQVDIKGEELLPGNFSDIYFEAKALDLISHSSIMDKKAHDALLTNKYPNISFKMTAVQNIKAQDGSFAADIAGVLSVAGKSRNIVLRAIVVYSDSSYIAATGNIEMKMTDFGITPPTAILGTLKTGDEITVKIDLKFRV